MTAEMYSDFELIQAWKGGDARAFEALFARYKRPLYGYISRMVNGDAAQVDDLFQQLWLRVVKKLPVYREQDRFQAWIFRIARNITIDYYRSRGRRPALMSLDDEDNMPELAETGVPEPWQALDDRALAEELERLVAELPPEQREVFICRRNNLSFREIADLQKCPVNTALARMQYALKHLRKRLNDEFERTGYE